MGSNCSVAHLVYSSMSKHLSPSCWRNSTLNVGRIMFAALNGLLNSLLGGDAKPGLRGRLLGENATPKGAGAGETREKDDAKFLLLLGAIPLDPSAQDLLVFGLCMSIVHDQKSALPQHLQGVRAIQDKFRVRDADNVEARRLRRPVVVVDDLSGYCDILPDFFPLLHQEIDGKIVGVEAEDLTSTQSSQGEGDRDAFANGSPP